MIEVALPIDRSSTNANLYQCKSSTEPFLHANKALLEDQMMDMSSETYMRGSS